MNGNGNNLTQSQYDSLKLGIEELQDEIDKLKMQLLQKKRKQINEIGKIREDDIETRCNNIEDDFNATTNRIKELNERLEILQAKEKRKQKRKEEKRKRNEEILKALREMKEKLNILEQKLDQAPQPIVNQTFVEIPDVPGIVQVCLKQQPQ